MPGGCRPGWSLTEAAITLDGHSTCCSVELYAMCGIAYGCTYAALQARPPPQALPDINAASHARCWGLQALLAEAAGAQKPYAPALPAGSGSADSTLTALGARRAADGHVIIGLGSLGPSRHSSSKGRAAVGGGMHVAAALGSSGTGGAAIGGGARVTGGDAHALVKSGFGGPQSGGGMLRVTAAIAARLSAMSRQDCAGLSSMRAPGHEQEARRGFGDMQSGEAERGAAPSFADPAATGADAALRRGGAAQGRPASAAPMPGQYPAVSPSLDHPNASVRAAARYLALVAAGRAFGAPPEPRGPDPMPLGPWEADPAAPRVPAQEPCTGSAASGLPGGTLAAGSGGEPGVSLGSYDFSSQHPSAADRLFASGADEGPAAADGLASKRAAAAALAKKAAMEDQEAHVLRKGLEHLTAWMRECAGTQAADGGSSHGAPAQGTNPSTAGIVDTDTLRCKGFRGLVCSLWSVRSCQAARRHVCALWRLCCCWLTR